MSVGSELDFNGFQGGKLDLVFGVAGEIGNGFAGQGPASPGAPLALFLPRWT